VYQSSFDVLNRDVRGRFIEKINFIIILRFDVAVVVIVFDNFSI